MTNRVPVAVSTVLKNANFLLLKEGTCVVANFKKSEYVNDQRSTSDIHSFKKRQFFGT